MQQLFHLGIPKSGTTTIQRVLKNDERIIVTRSRYFSSKDWWLNENVRYENDKIIIESNETLLSGGFQKVKFFHILDRIQRVNKNAKIIITIREQESALMSMYKYHLKNNFEGTENIRTWMFDSNLGIDYLSICMFGDIANIILAYFPVENISFLFYEELKDDPNSFYKKLYKILNIPFDEKYMPTNPLNVMPFNLNQLYTLAMLNRFSLTKIRSTKRYDFSKFRAFENRIKKGIIRRYSLTASNNYFSFNTINEMDKIRDDFRRSNNKLVDLGLIKKDELKKYNYLH